MDIEGKVVLVTGASAGIGAATARLAAKAGGRLVLAARRAERIEALADELPDAVAIATDLTDPAQIPTAVQVALDAYGRVDVLVNNAGQGLHLPLEQVDPDDFRAVLELNVVAPLIAMQAVLPTMRGQGGGAIVNVSSGTARAVIPGLGAYAATKAALTMLSAVARKEFAAEGIVVSTVFPKVTDTEFHDVLRAGSFAPPPGMPQAHTAEQVAEVILELIRSGDEEAHLPY